MNKSPAFQFYPKDFLSDINVVSMNMEERGIYITLLSICWIEDGIPIDSPLVSNWLKTGSPLKECFYEKDGKLRNRRLDKERKKQVDWAKKSAEGGKSTQRKRWDGVEKLSRSERLKKARQKGTHTEDEWQKLQQICNNKCVICGVEKGNSHGNALCKDHIIPICLGGSDSIDNIQPICRNCNTGKTNKQIDARPKDWKKRLTNYQPTVNQRSTLQSSSSSSYKDKILTNLIVELIKKNDSKAKVPKENTPQFDKWCDHIRLCRERDKRTETEIERAIRFSQEDEFWKANILSTAKLRAKLPQLLHQASRGSQERYVGSTPQKPKSPEQQKFEGAIKAKRQEIESQYRSELSEARKSKDKNRWDEIHAIINNAVAAYSQELEG